MKPVMAAAASTAATDDQLVAAARAGSDEAIEALYRRYRDRITGYVRGILRDDSRSEDVVQEAFISAFRSLRETEQTIAFKPWIYQIARNACIDQLRRLKRAEEVSIDSDDFKPSEEGRLSQAAPTTDGEVSQRETFDAFRQAFGGLPRSQHEALVLREFEGLSYAEIGSRMRLSPAAVESMLFRARRGLKYEYQEIETGERCRRMQVVMAALAEGLGESRDRRALARHVEACSLCRHEAIAMGLGTLIATRRDKVKAALHKAAALLPLPRFLRRKDGADASRVFGPGARAQSAVSQLGLAVGPAGEQAAGAFPKAVAVLVAAAVIAGGSTMSHSAGPPLPPPSSPAAGSGPVGQGIFDSTPGSPAALRSAAGWAGTSSPLTGRGDAGGGLGASGISGALGGALAKGTGSGSLSLPGSVPHVGATAPDSIGGSLPSLGGGSLPDIGGSSGGGIGSVSVPKVPDSSSLSVPKVLDQTAPSTLPTVPKAPKLTAPSLPSGPSTSSPGSTIDQATGTVQGTTQTLQGATSQPLQGTTQTLQGATQTIQGTTGPVSTVTSGLGL